MKSEKELIKLARRSSFIKNPKVSFLAEGFGNENYLLEESGERYVLRLKKSTESQFFDSLEKENSFLKYFEHQGVDFCPKALYFDRDENFLIENYIEGDLVPQRDFSDDQIDVFAQQLHQLFTLSVPGFAIFCEENSLKCFDYVDQIEGLRIYGFNRFNEVKKEKLPKEVVNWIEKTLRENLKYLESENENELGFTWGDIQSKLIIDSSGKMNFYDFEHACISNSFGLSYIKIHGSFASKQIDFLIERCAHYFKRSKESLVVDMNANEKIVGTNDAVWAAMKWSATGKREYEDLMYARIDLVKNINTNNSFEILSNPNLKSS
tara:strand:- start:636 stop:1601 length:966 start_codon:yes stop_codon:yes gene_type:complete